MNILYLTWGEDVKPTGLFLNQVYEQLKIIKKENPGINITVLSGVPIIRRIAELFDNARKIRSLFNSAGIRYEYRILCAMSRWFYSKKWQLHFYHLFQLAYLKKTISKLKIDIVHCRSYHAALIMQSVKEKYNLEVKIIFDTRGMFPEEGALMGYLSPSSQHYEYWKAIEKKLFKEVDVIVNVSREHTEHVRKISDCNRILTIFTSVNNEIFYRHEAIRTAQRDKHNIKKNTVVLGYSGSIGNKAWHSFDMLMKQYLAFKSCFNETRLLIITMNGDEIVNKIQGKYSNYFNEIMVFSSNKTEEINGWLNICDFAALPYREITNDYEKMIGHTMLASKTGEYLSAGLPLIINENIGAASSLVKDRCIGVIYPTIKESGIDKNRINELYKKRDDVSLKCISTSIELFGSINNAKKYIDIYNNI